MKRDKIVLIFPIMALLMAGCNVKVFISDTRLRGPVPSAQEMAAAQATQVAAEGPPTPTPSAQESADIAGTIRALTDLVGKDLVAVAGFSGKETPNSGPLRGMRVEAGDFIRVSAGRSQDVAVESTDYCVEERCSRVWVHGRPKGGSQGAWYPIVIFDYPKSD